MAEATFVIESYDKFTDELYREYYLTKEEMIKGLHAMSIREDWAHAEQSIEKLLVDGEIAEGYEYIKVSMIG